MPSNSVGVDNQLPTTAGVSGLQVTVNVKSGSLDTHRLQNKRSPSEESILLRIDVTAEF
jgi:hypothetical protein